MRISARIAIVPTLATLIACSGTPGEFSPQTAPTPLPAGRQTLFAIEPNVALSGHEVDVKVVGAEGTDFDEANTLTLGPDITVSRVSVVSKWTLTAHLAISGDAAPGPRDVVARAPASASYVLVGRNLFNVAARINVALSGGSPAQGGVIAARIVSPDGVGFAGASSQMVGPIASLGVGATLFSSAPAAASFVGFIDPLAPVGDTGVELANVASSETGPTFFAQAFLSRANIVRVRPATPTPLAFDTLLSGETIDVPFGTRLYKTSAVAPGIVSVTVSPTGARLVPRLNVYPTSGASADFVASSAGEATGVVTVAYPAQGWAADTYAVVSDIAFGGGGSEDYGYAIAASFTPADRDGAELQTGPHATPQTAQPMCDESTPWSTCCVLSGDIAVAAERDVYRLPDLNSDVDVYVKTGSDVHAWIGRTAADGTLVALAGGDLTPTWPAHAAHAQVFAGSTPTYLVVDGLTGGLVPLGRYTFGLVPVSESR